MMDSDQDPMKPSTVQSIQEVERKVLDVVETSALVVEELSKFGDADEKAVIASCQKLMASTKEIHTEIQNAISSRMEVKDFENNDFVAKQQARFSVERADVVSQRLNRLRLILETGKRDLEMKDL